MNDELNQTYILQFDLYNTLIFVIVHWFQVFNDLNYGALLVPFFFAISKSAILILPLPETKMSRGFTLQWTKPVISECDINNNNNNSITEESVGGTKIGGKGWMLVISGNGGFPHDCVNLAYDCPRRFFAIFIGV